MEAVRGYGGEVSGEVSVFRKDQRPSRHEAVDQRLLLPHHLNYTQTNQNEKGEGVVAAATRRTEKMKYE